MLEANFLDIQALESAAAMASGESEAEQGVAGIRYSRDGNLSEIQNGDGSVWRLNESGSWIKYDMPGNTVNGIKRDSNSASRDAGAIKLPAWINKIPIQ